MLSRVKNLLNGLCFFVIAVLVTFKDYADGKEHNIEGMFPLSDPWWSATLFLSGGPKKQLVGCRTFKLRSDERLTKERVVWLFVRSCMRVRDNEYLHEEATEAFHRALK